MPTNRLSVQAAKTKPAKKGSSVGFVRGYVTAVDNELSDNITIQTAHGTGRAKATSDHPWKVGDQVWAVKGADGKWLVTGTV